MSVGVTTWPLLISVGLFYTGTNFSRIRYQLPSKINKSRYALLTHSPFGQTALLPTTKPGLYVAYMNGILRAKYDAGSCVIS